ncbi:hypothetical protein OU798_16400 [Prolixibacteraceae bacterium Z1-6]|uniref:Uncharacterized protein n=1 Tax=Draconibacterium aestuarii TaxID=2998507 RepID=A0A9X3J7W3_9BACT|nr:hypothetical protein [Prolixibacteraceae bacterium Z1-6]
MKIWFFTLIFIFVSIGLKAQESNDSTLQNSLFEPVSESFEDVYVFDSNKPLKLTLKYDITSFIRKKMKGEYLAAEMYVHTSETDSIVKHIRLKARGNFRRGHCFFPPIYLNFKTDPIESTELKGLKKVKLVTHCSSGKAYESYILREYLAYKMYNVITDKSFRVRLVDIKYIDTGKKQRNYQRYGFLIEPVGLMVKRCKAVEVNSEIIKGKDIIEPEMDIVALFQFMIANTDWRAKGGHNLKYIKSLSFVSNKVSPVPYDFDYSGFVGTHYAEPQEWTSINNIKEREYLGYCRNTDQAYLNAISVFLQKQDKILETIRSFEYLNEKERNNLITFIQQFYTIAERPKSLANMLKNQCRDNDF